MVNFGLVNELGERRNLNYSNAPFLANVSGLGVGFNNIYDTAGKGFFQNVNKNDAQTPIVGDLVFLGGNAYNIYNDFYRWIARSRELYFLYKPFGATEYRKKVEVTYLQKGIRGSNGILRVPVSFASLSPWYAEFAAYFSFEESDNVLRCDFAGSVIDDAIFSDSVFGGNSATVQSQGQIDAAFKLVFRGAIVNPTITVTGKTSNTVYGVCAATLQTQDGDVLTYSSSYEESSLILTRNNVDTDMISSVDLSHNVFPKLSVSETCVVSVAADSTIPEVDGRVYYYFRTV